MEVELCVDAVEAAKGNVTLSLPELGTMQAFPAVFSAGPTKSTFVLHLDPVRQASLALGQVKVNLLEAYCHWDVTAAL